MRLNLLHILVIVLVIAGIIYFYKKYKGQG